MFLLLLDCIDDDGGGVGIVVAVQVEPYSFAFFLLSVLSTFSSAYTLFKEYFFLDSSSSDSDVLFPTFSSPVSLQLY